MVCEPIKRARACRARDASEGSLDHHETPSAFANRMWLMLGLKRKSNCAYDFQVSIEADIDCRIQQMPRRIQDAFGSSASILRIYAHGMRHNTAAFETIPPLMDLPSARP